MIQKNSFILRVFIRFGCVEILSRTPVLVSKSDNYRIKNAIVIIIKTPR